MGYSEELDRCRQEINGLDKIISEALAKRFEVVEKIGEIKKDNGLPVLNKNREEEVLARVSGVTDIPRYAEGIKDVYRAIMAAARGLEGEKEDIS